MSLSNKDSEEIGAAIDKCADALSSAIILVVKALKNQPGFDIEKFYDDLVEEEKKEPPTHRLTQAVLGRLSPRIPGSSNDD